jgi:hypothetical protein
MQTIQSTPSCTRSSDFQVRHSRCVFIINKLPHTSFRSTVFRHSYCAVQLRTNTVILITKVSTYSTHTHSALQKKVISAKIKLPRDYTKIVYVYILHKRRYYTQNGTTIRYIPDKLQNLQIATKFHLVILYGKMKIPFYSVHWLILHIHQRKEASWEKKFSINRVKWYINNIATYNFYNTAQQKTPIIIKHYFNTFLSTQFIIVFHVLYVSLLYLTMQCKRDIVF